LPLYLPLCCGLSLAILTWDSLLFGECRMVRNPKIVLKTQYCNLVKNTVSELRVSVISICPCFNTITIMCSIYKLHLYLLHLSQEEMILLSLLNIFYGRAVRWHEKNVADDLHTSIYKKFKKYKIEHCNKMVCIWIENCPKYKIEHCNKIVCIWIENCPINSTVGVSTR